MQDPQSPALMEDVFQELQYIYGEILVWRSACRAFDKVDIDTIGPTESLEPATTKSEDFWQF
ncbi:hypothetical protein LOZ51_006604 [Ophidiomyces ophidiicola]|nr:hypothetical protein LOZ55_004662 [Ophidiomyces ophidiicola]KAI1984707.1 hypothetical protein LOZ51_006604 [Ophidiomyces ophidiicola]KAI1993165.1 hypothetical protein LOZ54_001514 [Ophidiomyces ophidiicola]